MIDLKAWRTGHGMTQQQAADALGIGHSTVRAIEAGTRDMSLTIALACRCLDHEATAYAPAPAGPDYGDYEKRLTDEMPPTRGDIDAIHARLATNEEDAGGIMKRLAAAERDARSALQRAQEACMAIEEAGLPIHQQAIPMTDEDREEAELKLRKAQIIDDMNRAAKAAPGALTDEERAEADKARRMIAKARTLANGEPWD